METNEKRNWTEDLKTFFNWKVLLFILILSVWGWAFFKAAKFWKALFISLGWM